MRFPDPAARACARCGRPTVVAETAIASVRVHCGTWRWQCDTPSERNRYESRAGMSPEVSDVPGAAGLAA